MLWRQFWEGLFEAGLEEDDQSVAAVDQTLEPTQSIFGRPLRPELYGGVCFAGQIGGSLHGQRPRLIWRQGIECKFDEEGDSRQVLVFDEGDDLPGMKLDEQRPPVIPLKIIVRDGGGEQKIFLGRQALLQRGADAGSAGGVEAGHEWAEGG